MYRKRSKVIFERGKTQKSLFIFFLHLTLVLWCNTMDEGDVDIFLHDQQEFCRLLIAQSKFLNIFFFFK